jgi:hypothetical protein
MQSEIIIKAQVTAGDAQFIPSPGQRTPMTAKGLLIEPTTGLPKLISEFNALLVVIHRRSVMQTEVEQIAEQRRSSGQTEAPRRLDAKAQRLSEAIDADLRALNDLRCEIDRELRGERGPWPQRLTTMQTGNLK